MVFSPYDFVSDMMQKVTNEKENAIIEMLKNNGYKIQEPITAEIAKNICHELALKDKWINTIEFFKSEEIEDGILSKYTVIPFLDSISHPLSEEAKNEIVQKYLKGDENANKF